MLVSGSMDATVRVTDGRTGNELKTYEGHQAGILDLDANDQIIVTCSDDGNCLVFPIPTN